MLKSTEAKVDCVESTNCIKMQYCYFSVTLGYRKKANSIDGYQNIILITFFNSYCTDNSHWNRSSVILTENKNCDVGSYLWLFPSRYYSESDVEIIAQYNFIPLRCIDTALYGLIRVLTLDLMRDLLHIHNSTPAFLGWLYELFFDHLYLSLETNLNWESHAVINCSYGVSSKERYNFNQKHHYITVSNAIFTISNKHKINNHWNLLLIARAADLNFEIVIKSIVNNNYSLRVPNIGHN